MNASLRRKLTYRRFVAVALAAAMVLVACGGQDDETPEGSGDDSTTDDTTDDTGDDANGSADGPTGDVDTLVFALTPPDPETNRHWASGSPGQLQLEPYMERLLGNDLETGAAAPELAVEWEANDDFTEWTLQLREGVQFHHGWGEFTADDVVLSVELMGRDDSVLETAEMWAGAEAEALGPYEVLIRFAEPQIFALDFFSGERPDGFIYSAAQWDAEGEAGIDSKPAGTGHYMYDERSSGEWIRFTRNPDHWSGELAESETIEFRWEPEDSTRLARVLSGEAHVTDIGRELHPQAIDEGLEIVRSNVENHQSFLAFTGTSMGQADYEPNMDIPWVADARVRGALNKAINRDEVIEFIYEGDAKPIIALGWTPEREGWSDEWAADWDEYYGYDPDRAVELLAEAGYEPSDITPTLWSFEIAGSPEWPLLMEFVQQQWEQIGIRATIEETQFDIVREQVVDRAGAEGHIYPLRNTPIRQPQILQQNLFDAESRYGMFNTPESEDILDQWQVAIDPDERDRLANEFGDIKYYEWGAIPLAQFGAAFVVDPDVVAGWDFPGVTSAGMTQWENIRKD